MLKWDFGKLSTVSYETNCHELQEEYKNISLVTDTADVVFMPSEGQTTSVVCHEQKNVKHTVTVKDDTLVIAIDDTRKWYDYIGIHFGETKITVYIPQGEFGALSVRTDTGDVEIPKEYAFESIDISGSTGNVKSYAYAVASMKIQTSTGDISVENVSAGALDLWASTGHITVSDVTCQKDANIRVSTGKTTLTNLSCKNLTSTGTTGNITLKQVIATEKFSIQRGTGDVQFNGCDAAEILVKTDTGDVVGSLLTDKIFIAQTDTGKVDVPKSVTGGKCEVTTDTGNIKLHIG